jgi:ribose transport system permease protein
LSTEHQQTARRESGLERFSIWDALERGGLLILFVLLVFFFAVLPSSSSAFTSSGNVTNLLAGQSVTGLIALAMIVPLTCGYFDLSVAAVAGMAEVATAALMSKYGLPPWAAICGAVLVGAITGCVNGYLVAYVKLNGFIVTLGTYTFVGGLVQLYTNGESIINGIPLSFSNWSSENWLGVPRPFVLLILAAVVVWYALMQTPFGRELEGIGSNERAARLVGVRVEMRVFATFVISGAIAGIAGALMASRAGGANPTDGPGYLFPALTAVFLGATAIRPGRYNVWGTLLGVYFVAVAINGFSLMGANTWITPVFNGAALIVAVTISTLMARHRERQALRLRRIQTLAADHALPRSDADRAAAAHRVGEQLRT